MFPIGESTGLLQAVREAEDDVYALLLAARPHRPPFRTYILKYVAVAQLAHMDTVEALASIFFKLHGRQLEEPDTSAIRSIKKAFELARLENRIEKRLRDEVRNIVSAHRRQQTIESISRTHEALRAPEFPKLFDASRRLVDTMEAVPVWSWGQSGADGVLAMRGSRVANWQADSEGLDGFEVRIPDGSASFNIIQEQEISTQAIADAREGEIGWMQPPLLEPRQLLFGPTVPLRI